MHAGINITDDDITIAESLLFSNGEKFDEERIVFIKNLDTIDLQAVPGSGKTTALMAKLLILERYLPLDYGSGILVISHTNAAINEIDNKIRKYCQRLFSYPNYIGTIQKFTNDFLAIPFYMNHYHKRPYCIDYDIYKEYAQNFRNRFFSGFTQQEQNNAKRFLLMNKELSTNLRYSHINGAIELTESYYGKVLEIRKPKGNTREQNYQDWNSDEKCRVKEWLSTFKTSLLREGILCFDDAYFLAFEYLSRYPQIKLILQKRFNLVFVDEMQDMEKHQHDLLEEIFFDGSRSNTKYQRIGDKNQAIYNQDVEVDEIWSERETLTINGSHRLTRPIADLVNCFALYRDADFHVNGLREGDLLPRLIVYNDTNISNVIRKYSEIIKSLNDEGKIPLTDSVFKVIAWRKAPGEGKIGIIDYYPDFNVSKHGARTNYSFLIDYLSQNNISFNSLAPIQENLINALLKILRLENILTDKKRGFSKYSLYSFLREHDETDFNEFNLNIFKWSMAIVHGEDVTNRVRSYIPYYLSMFNEEIDKSDTFINEDNDENIYENIKEKKYKPNTVNYHGFDIDITTIHAEKGKTHTATLYLETFYGNCRGNYESERLSEQLMFTNFNPNTNRQKTMKQSVKMMYVGISRPTHLLCVAVHKDRFNEHLSGINKENWAVTEI